MKKDVKSEVKSEVWSGLIGPDRTKTRTGLDWTQLTGLDEEGLALGLGIGVGGGGAASPRILMQRASGPQQERTPRSDICPELGEMDL
eukprot:CAMPEP_0195015136 /NCGR_PEP_ID=MMETSP0326_2-20130528/18087_1 /TAXON_ID=2866 ORGANISM="Crypthecodinium cohnii, Strain Seligo" /NCGR_SAMPLE_ID=MMETSP0326_2 /ASSEMBLY_ACC=CAM_ASM_000348 /LENGTH=87 /DNA_ID=CAMNT_0040028983 /DNA_START=75 /DNA_END=339 /DNA_ORIENTATION=-